jgi:hypothetical protein
MTRGLRRETYGLAIGALDTLGDWAGLIESACHTLCDRLCDRLDLIPTGVAERARLAKESTHA